MMTLILLFTLVSMASQTPKNDGFIINDRTEERQKSADWVI